VIHTSYLINLASANDELLDKSVRMVISELNAADDLDAEYVVIHTGSASGDNPDAARKRAAKALGMIAGSGRWQTGLLLENTAGERGDVTSRIRDIAELMDLVPSGLIKGICFDTCHAFSAGYDIITDSGIDSLCREISSCMDIGSVRLIHLNDSKKPFGAGVDRHEHLGEGSIGLKGLKRFVSHACFREVPLILETPKKTDEDDLRNLKLARNLTKVKY
jgi:deoxyribonuclease-4